MKPLFLPPLPFPQSAEERHLALLDALADRVAEQLENAWLGGASTEGGGRLRAALKE